MSEHCEEQEMEAEALEAIFMEAFEVLNDSQPFKWSVKLVPVDCGGDEEEEEKQNHVAIKLIARIPLDYPEVSPPELDVEVVKGLAGDQVKEILTVANDEAEANAGMPAIFAVCEAVRAWLAENNVKGLDDGSMHAQMMRKMKEKEKAKVSLNFRVYIRRSHAASEALSAQLDLLVLPDRCKFQCCHSLLVMRDCSSRTCNMNEYSRTRSLCAVSIESGMKPTRLPLYSFLGWRDNLCATCCTYILQSMCFLASHVHMRFLTIVLSFSHTAQ